MIARMQIRQTSWDALLTDPEPGEGIQVMLETGCTHVVEDAQNPAGFILVDCISPESRIDALWDYFAPADRIGHGDSDGPWKWGFDGKVNFPTEYTGQHNDILATQGDHVVYDGNGNEVSRDPASFENPNFSHGWLGQDQNRFAREHSREFGEDYA